VLTGAASGVLRRRRHEEPVDQRTRVLGAGAARRLRRYRAARQPDVAGDRRVNGFALGGGLEMVLGCDIVVAATRRPSACRAVVGRCRSMAA
jgi:enoyl-CoA hydratase/carnithine racemase